MILTGPEIERRMESGSSVMYGPRGEVETVHQIAIRPRPQHVGPNSADLTLADRVLYLIPPPDGAAFDTRTTPETREYTIPPEGLVLPSRGFVLGSTVERTITRGCVPWIDGRSTIARFGLFIHVSAGKGDDGFGKDAPGGAPWTLEIFNANPHPVRLYAGDRICQIFYLLTYGEQREYGGENAHYTDQSGPTPPRVRS